MSQIIHRCQTCGTPDTWRDGTTAGPTVDSKPPAADVARSCCRSRRWGPPQMVPTFDPNGHRMPSVVPPGGSAGGYGTKTCNCDQCVAFYAEATR